MVGSNTAPQAPSVVSVLFGDSGKDLYVVFDSDTDLGGFALRSSWACSSLLVFSGANSSTCSWLNTTAIQGIFPSSLNDSTVLLTVGSNVTLFGNVIRPYCSDSTVICNGYNYTTQTSAKIATAFNPVSPVVVLVVPSTIGGCDNLTVNAIQSTGSGGRSWSSIQWRVSEISGSADTTAIANVLQAYGDAMIDEVLTVSRSLFTPGTYTISLTLKNFFGNSNTGSVDVVIASGSYIPRVSISGSSAISIVASTALSVYGSATFSSCTAITRSIRLTYSYQV